MVPPIWPAPVYRLARAISIAEGSNPLWNNSLDVTGADSFGFPTDGVVNSDGVLKFVNAQDGVDAGHLKIWRALRGVSKVYTLDMTIEQMGTIYSKGNINWAKNVAAELGVPVTATLREIAAG